MAKYILTYFNAFKEPYYNISSKQLNQHMMSETWVTEDFDTVLEWLKGTLDIPTAELTAERIHKDFDNPQLPQLSEDKVVKILNYYNGRWALYKTIIRDLENHKTPCILHYNIPPEYNTIEVYSDSKTEQIDAYIEITIS